MPVASPDLLFEIDYAPSAAFASLEALEPILAAAALEYSIAVVLHGPAMALLRGQDSRRWRQLKDFDLAELLTTQRPDDQQIDAQDALTARPIDASEIEQLRKNARTILKL